MKLKITVFLNKAVVERYGTILEHINLLTPKISLVILLSVCHTILMMSIWRSTGSTNNPLIDIIFYSHLFYACFCIDIVRRNSQSLMGGKGLSQLG